MPVQEAERSDVVGANVLQVVELQLQLAYSHVLRGQLLLQPPQLVLLPEEHPQKLRNRKQTLTLSYTLANRFKRLMLRIGECTVMQKHVIRTEFYYSHSTSHQHGTDCRERFFILF